MSETSRRFKVFVVDDSILMRDRLSELLATIPHVDVVGGSGTVTGAIARIRVGGIDAVLLDMDLQDGSGMDVLKAIKQGPDAPVVIVLTIYSVNELGSHCQAAGADYYFEKGASFDGVFSLLEKLSTRHAGTAP